MSLADRTPRSSRRTGQPCAIARLYATLDPKDAETLRGWLADENLSSRAIHAELVDELGFPHAEQVVSRHRRHRTAGGCMCEDL